MNDIQIGALAGFVATASMTLFMEEVHERLPWWQRYRLPPRQITMNAAHQAGICHDLNEEQRLVATMAAHFAVGTTAGAIYGPLSRTIPGPAVLSGAAFGLGVWAANYLAILPGLGLLDPPTQHPPQRAGLMIAAHLVWGAAAGWLVATMRKRNKRRVHQNNERQRSQVSEYVI